MCALPVEPSVASDEARNGMPPDPLAKLDAPAVAAWLAKLESALSANDADEAATALDAIMGHPSIPAGALDGAARQTALWRLDESNWEAAHRELARLEEPTPQDRHLRCFTGNFQALRQHRPQVAGALQKHLRSSMNNAEGSGKTPATVLPTIAPSSPYRLFRDDAGHTRIAQRDSNGSFNPLPPGPYFDDFLKQTRGALEKHPDHALVLLSVADGHALTWLAGHEPELFMDQRLTVHVVEPDLDRLLIAMHLHDWSTPAGPIAEPRFQWHVGDAWESMFTDWGSGRPWTPLPVQAVCPDPQLASALGERIRKVSQQVQSDWTQRNEAVMAKYAAQDDVDRVALFGPNPPRTPRIAVLTSRFTTVLQYAAKDSAAALRRLGWDARVFMEDHPHERFSPYSVIQAFEKFEPDAVFTIDSPRAFVDAFVPPRVPVLCWIQDALPRLMNENIGQATTTRDFVLTFFAPRLTVEHAYPPRQCIDMPMMVTKPRIDEPGLSSAAALADLWSQRSGPDLIYASNVSATAEGLLDIVLAKAKGDAARVLEPAARRLVEHYAQGRHFSTEPDVDAWLDMLVGASVIPPHPPAFRRQVRDALWNPLNTGLYRQQALAWVADYADANGLSLHVHGRGWSENPRFASYDYGPLNHEQLQAATAEAKFALHLEPYICFSHHRMLDAIQAGTPVLVRTHPGDSGLQRVAAFLAEHAPDAQSDSQVFDSLGDHETAGAYRALATGLRGVTLDLAGDVAAQVRAWQRAGVLPDTDGRLPAMPELDAVSFRDAHGFASRITDLLATPDRVGVVLAAQRAAVNQRLTFDAALGRVLARIHGLLISETQTGGAA